MSRLDEQNPQRLPWLAGAGQQSHALAELRAAHPAPFRWERPLPTRPRWAVAALAAAVLGLATVTLATLHARRASAPAPATTVQPLGGRSTAAAPRRPEPRPVVSPAPAPAEKPAPPRRRPSRAARRAPPEKPVAAAPEAADGKVTFDGNEPGDSVIIVTPPTRKLKPLWTPEQYKKERAGRLR